MVWTYSSITTPDSKLRQLTRSKFCTDDKTARPGEAVVSARACCGNVEKGPSRQLPGGTDL